MRANRGFSILEIIIFITLLSVVLVAGVGYTIRVLRVTLINQHKLIANHYVQEAQEWLAGEREADWQEFQRFASNGSGRVYCVNNELELTDTMATALVLVPPGTCNFNGIISNPATPPTIYRRRITLRKDTPAAETASTVTAIIEVSWVEDGITYVDSLETAYSLWQ